MINKILPSNLPSQPIPSPRGSVDQLEQVFLEEMLKHTGLETSQSAFGGGVGEEHFGTFLTREYAALLSKSLDMKLMK